MTEEFDIDMSSAALLRVKAIWTTAQQYAPLKAAREAQQEIDARVAGGEPVEPVAIDGTLLIEALRRAGADEETIRYFFVYLAALKEAGMLEPALVHCRPLRPPCSPEYRLGIRSRGNEQ